MIVTRRIFSLNFLQIDRHIFRAFVNALGRRYPSKHTSCVCSFVCIYIAASPNIGSIGAFGVYRTAG
jgi:hypothetical protein